MSHRISKTKEKHKQNSLLVYLEKKIRILIIRQVRMSFFMFENIISGKHFCDKQYYKKLERI